MNISILIPTYERPIELKRCLNSLINNSPFISEIIISDNTITNKNIINNKSIIKDFNNILPLKYFHQEINIGESRNREFLLNKASSTWAIFLADDDILLQNSLSKLTKDYFILKNEDIIYFGYKCINESTGKYYKRSIPLKPLKINCVKNETEIIKDYLACDFMPYAFFHPATFLFRVDKVKKIPISFSDIVGIGDDYCSLIAFALNNFNIIIHPSIVMGYYKDLVSERDITNQSNQFNSSNLARYGIYILLMRSIQNNTKELGEINNFKLTNYLTSREFEKRFIRNNRIFFLNRIYRKLIAIHKFINYFLYQFFNE